MGRWADFLADLLKRSSNNGDSRKKQHDDRKLLTEIFRSDNIFFTRDGREMSIVDNLGRIIHV